MSATTKSKPKRKRRACVPNGHGSVVAGIHVLVSCARDTLSFALGNWPMDGRDSAAIAECVYGTLKDACAKLQELEVNPVEACKANEH